MYRQKSCSVILSPVLYRILRFIAKARGSKKYKVKFLLSYKNSLLIFSEKLNFNLSYFFFLTIIRSAQKINRSFGLRSTLKLIYTGKSNDPNCVIERRKIF